MVALVAFRLSGGLVGLKDDADGVEVIHFIEGNLFILHLAPGRIRGLDPLLDLEPEAGFLQGLFYGLDEFAHLGALFFHGPVNAGLYIGIGLGLLITQPDVLQFTFDAVQAQAVGQRDENEHGFREDLVTLVLRHVLYGAAIVQAVGQFNEDHTHVIVEGEEDALEILGLEALLG